MTNHYKMKKQAAMDTQNWLDNGQQPWDEFKKKMLLRYGFSSKIMERIREELEA